MTKRNALINLTLVFGIWFCLAFSCSSGSRRSTSTGETTQPTTGKTQSGDLTQEDVRAYFQERAENAFSGCKNFVVSIDAFHQYPAVQLKVGVMAERRGFPVSLDYTQSMDCFSGRTVDDLDHIAYHTKGAYDVFARHVVTGEWETFDGKDGVTTKEVNGVDRGRLVP